MNDEARRVNGFLLLHQALCGPDEQPVPILFFAPLIVAIYPNPDTLSPHKTILEVGDDRQCPVIESFEEILDLIMQPPSVPERFRMDLNKEKEHPQ